MTDKPLTDRDVFYIDSFGHIHDGDKVYFEIDIISAKRLLKHQIRTEYGWTESDIAIIDSIIDACFQIDDGKEAKE